METKTNVYARFATRKSQELFLELSNSLEGKSKELFSKYVSNLFDLKSTSEEGAYKEFKITEEDVAAIYDMLSSALKVGTPV